MFASHINGIGAGQLVARDDPKLYNTDKERNIVTPANDHFIKMANECVQQRITIDLFYALAKY